MLFVTCCVELHTKLNAELNASINQQDDTEILPGLQNIADKVKTTAQVESGWWQNKNIKH